MGYIKLFEEFVASLTESGNSVENARPFEQDEVEPTMKWLDKNVFKKIGLSGLGDDVAIIGSAGKKLPGDTSGDIDVAISADKVAGALNVSLQNVLTALDTELKRLGYVTKVAAGFNQVSIPAPIGGNIKNGVGQVDLMLSTDLNWSKFIYDSPDFRIGESQYKGAYRNILLMSVIGQCFGKVLSKTDDGLTKEYEARVIRMNQGIVQIRKTFVGKNGLIKTAKLMRDFDKEITREPQEIMDMLFSGNHKPKEINTYEKLKALIESGSFKFPEKVDPILAEFKMRMERSGLPLPKDIG